MKNQIKQVLEKYDPKKIRIGVLGSHSALEIASGAKQEGFETVVVCQKAEKKHTLNTMQPIRPQPCFSKILRITSEKNVKQLTDLNTSFVPNRALAYIQATRTSKTNLLFHYGQQVYATDRRA